MVCVVMELGMMLLMVLVAWETLPSFPDVIFMINLLSSVADSFFGRPFLGFSLSGNMFPAIPEMEALDQPISDAILV